MIRLAIVTGMLHPRYGGPSTVVGTHFQVLSKISNLEVELIGVADPNEIDALKHVLPQAQIFKAAFPKRWLNGEGLFNYIRKRAPALDVIHAHNVWDGPVLAAAFAAKQAKKPLIITPHGTFVAPWRYSSLHKQLYRRAFLKDVFSKGTVVHALNEAEKVGCLEFGVKGPIEVIPNGIMRGQFFEVGDSTLARALWPLLSERKIILYVGRLWRDKGLDILPRVWAELVRSGEADGWMLVLAGPDYGDYQRVLEAEIDALGIGDSVRLVGPVNGEIKRSLFAAAEVVVLPSYSEGFSMVILEAMAAKKPVLFTRACNFQELAAERGGWEIEPSPQALQNELSKILGLPRDVLIRTGEAGWGLGVRKYTAEAVGQDLNKMYERAIAQAQHGREEVAE